MIATILRNHFQFRPVLPSSLIKQFIGLEHTALLFAIIKEFTPKDYARASELMPVDAMNQFAAAFSKKFFPVRAPELYGYIGDKERGANESIERFIRCIPLKWAGLRQYDYDSGQIAAGQLVAAVICEVPTGINVGARISIIDRFKKKAKWDKKPLPATGYPIEHVIQTLTPEPETYSGLLDWCQWLYTRTGNVWLDTSSGNPGWDRETVDILARDYKLYLEAEARMKDFSFWLNKDFPERSAEVIRYVMKKIKNRPKTLMEILIPEETVGNNDETEAAGGHCGAFIPVI